MESLRRTLRRIDGKGYRAYRDIEGAHHGEGFVLHVDRVQGDPFAAPSRLRVVVDPAYAGFPAHTYEGWGRELGLRDLLTRAFAGEARARSKRRGHGKSGEIGINAPGQEVLERTSMFVGEDGVEARFVVGLPARGRTVQGRQAEQMLCDELPEIIAAALTYGAHDPERVRRHLDTVEDFLWMQDQLQEMGLVAFVADGAILPRVSGVDDRPMRGSGVVAFASPASMRVTMERPRLGEISGMGIREGITLITGGGYHGKSTLLQALAKGVHPHVPGDGREFVVTSYGSVGVRAEDGRAVRGVDISAFISGLPGGQDTTRFVTEDASGSTSQAAGVCEALEAGAWALLMDEDTCATNFMIRDARVAALIEEEPITPFRARIEELVAAHELSVLLVVGGSGDFFDVADTVLAMRGYRAFDETARAREIADALPSAPLPVPGALEEMRPRRLEPGSLDASRGKRDVKIRARGLETLSFGEHDIDVSALRGLVEPGQVRAIGEALLRLKAMARRAPQASVGELLAALEEELEEQGLGVLTERRGDLVMPRIFEVAGALSRLRALQVRDL